MNVTRSEPWRLFDLLHRDLIEVPARFRTATGAAEWVPAVDILEEKERFVLRADLPGIDPDAIEISLEKGVLTLAGERRDETNAQAEGSQRIERASGRFRRRFTLPETVDAGNVSARSANGILEITIPKQPEVQPRRITVQAA
ncbi:MAG TPA: Hsp20/alpha crystallin family protein [Woeseiaceae bacterium]|nr:Hsp20/alpha crystallin family protein [Woeseiaceae bacterium]